MNILAIGNSFSQDATRYLHRIARADGIALTVINLYIGGCPLSLHYKNMLTDAKKYAPEINGECSRFTVSLSEALTAYDWDYITFQQVSHLSVDYDTYQPYLNALSEYVNKYAPKAKQIIHQTWAYEDGSHRLQTELGYEKSEDMYNDILKSYNMAAKAIDAEFIIPSGALMQTLIKNNITPVHRDTFHASYGTARYAMALLWYKMLTGNDVLKNTFSDFDEEIPSETVALIKEIVSSL